MPVETLDYPLLDIKADDATRTFSGYGSTFHNKDLVSDVILPGAFQTSLARHARNSTRPVMLWSHKADQVPGRWLDIHEDRVGLAVRGEFLDTALGRDTYTLVKSGAVRGLSIGFRVQQESYNADGSRVLKELDLAEVSVCALPCNESAVIGSVKFAELAERCNSISAFERTCREKFGASKTQAKQLAREWWPGFRKVAHGEPASNSLETLRDELQSATLCGDIHARADRIRRIKL